MAPKNRGLLEASEVARYAAYLYRRWLWRRGLDRTLVGIGAATDARVAAERALEGSR